MSKPNIYLGLVHNPVYDRNMRIVTTSVTNLDIHDISRSCLSFGVKKYFLITPVESQHQLVRRILSFWETEMAKAYNADRNAALQVLMMSNSIDEAIKWIKNQEGSDPVVITTTARAQENQLCFSDFIKVYQKNKPILLLFGTGNGLVKEVHDQADFILEPVSGVSDYNHLSVRSAVAIILDRISSVEYKEEPWTSFKP
ncbi:MAG TPA: RNA methyltransferase [Candidatus Cloacimonadota bacterium]|nr:RNA methyltransferase [Candidatus Cloacimonadota bacterium]HPT71337.1 RNA methyltransferase [Candidatus Cloacimonadota bacterium]